MTDRFPVAWMVSLTMHAAIAGLMFLLAYAAEQSRAETTKVFELVAGEGDNFAATEAPARGEPGGIKVEVPEPPAPKPEELRAPEVAPEPESLAVTPAPPKPVEKPLPKLPNLSKMIEKKVDRAEAKAKATIAKKRAAEAKKLSKEEFDRQNKKKVAAKPAGVPKIAKIDSEGIRKGVVGGSTENKTGGAGGKALTREDGPVMDAYFALLRDRLRTALEKPPGLSDTLVTIVQVSVNANGSLTGARITKSSGSAEFDAAVMAAVAATQMPPRPDKKSETVSLPFRMKEQDGG